MSTGNDHAARARAVPMTAWTEMHGAVTIEGGHQEPVDAREAESGHTRSTVIAQITPSPKKGRSGWRQKAQVAPVPVRAFRGWPAQVSTARMTAVCWAARWRSASPASVVISKLELEQRLRCAGTNEPYLWPAPFGLFVSDEARQQLCEPGSPSPRSDCLECPLGRKQLNAAADEL
jgi:hypothetical protein